MYEIVHTNCTYKLYIQMVHTNGTYSSELKLLFPLLSALKRRRTMIPALLLAVGLEKKLLWIGEKMQFLHTSMLIS
jgi:hypothetical protein